MKYRKKPVEVDAVQYTGKNLISIKEWYANCHINKKNPGESYIYIKTLEGMIKVNVGDWIIKNAAVAGGEFYVCKPDIFEKTYEKVEE